MVEERCTDSSNCTLIKPDGTEIVRKCFETESVSGNFCGCNDFYGWKGEFCDQPSIQLRIWRIFSILRTLVALVLLLWSLFLFKKVLKIQNIPPDTKKGLFLILIFAFLSLFCSLLYGILSFLPAYDETAFELYTYKFFLDEDLSGVNQKYGVIADIMSSLVIIFSVVTSLQISVSWINLIEKFDSIFQTLKHKNKLLFYKETVKYISFGVTVLCVVSISLGYLIPAFASGSVIALLLLILFVSGRYNIGKQIKLSSLDTKNTLKLFNKSTKTHVIILTICMICFIGFIAVFDVLVIPGNISVSSIFFNLLLLSFNWLVYSDLWYVWKIVKNLNRNTLTLV